MNLPTKFASVFPCGSIVLATNRLANITAFHSSLKVHLGVVVLFFFLAQALAHDPLSAFLPAKDALWTHCLRK